MTTKSSIWPVLIAPKVSDSKKCFPFVNANLIIYKFVQKSFLGHFIDLCKIMYWFDSIKYPTNYKYSKSSGSFVLQTTNYTRLRIWNNSSLQLIMET